MTSAASVSTPSLAAARTGSESSSAVAAPPRARARRVVLALALLAGLGGVGLWYANRDIESTDNAQVDADVVAVPARVGGTVARVHFSENARVSAGALLAELDDAQLRAKLAQSEAALLAAQAAADGADAEAQLARTQALGNRAMARANLATNAAGVRASSDEIREGEAQVATAQASLTQAELDLARAEQLLASGTFARAQRDSAQTAHDVARARLAAARARLSSLQVARAQSASRVAEASAKLEVTNSVETLIKQAEARAKAAHAQVATAQAARDLAALELSYAKIHAPRDGVVSKKSINVGQMVGAGQSVVQLVPSERWVTANFKETQVARMRTGQRVRIHADAFPDRDFIGRVESFSGATGARFTLLPPDNATGNFTKVVQRIPVRIRLEAPDAARALWPGMSVEVDVDTHEG